MTTAAIKVELDIHIDVPGDLQTVVNEFNPDEYMRKKIIPALKKAGVMDEWIDGEAELTGVFK